jgi:hypothetical protein
LVKYVVTKNLKIMIFDKVMEKFGAGLQLRASVKPASSTVRGQTSETTAPPASSSNTVSGSVNAKGQLALPADPKAMEAYNMANKSDDILVIGRKTDTEIAQDFPGHQILDLPKDDWRLGINDAWMQGGIDRRATFYTATTSNATLQPSKYGPTVFERELIQLGKSGYIQNGNNIIPAK